MITTIKVLSASGRPVQTITEAHTSTERAEASARTPIPRGISTDPCRTADILQSREFCSFIYCTSYGITGQSLDNICAVQ